MFHFGDKTNIYFTLIVFIIIIVALIRSEVAGAPWLTAPWPSESGTTGARSSMLSWEMITRVSDSCLWWQVTGVLIIWNKKLQNWTIDALAILVLTCDCLLTCAVCTIFLTVWNFEIFEKYKTLQNIPHFEIVGYLKKYLTLWNCEIFEKYSYCTKYFTLNCSIYVLLM